MMQMKEATKYVSKTNEIVFQFFLFSDFIDLSQNELSGQLPESITKLRSLEYISLAFNEFKTSIPTFFGQMTSLNTLNLRSSGFVGQIPKEIGYLSYLGKFSFSRKQFTNKSSSI